MLSFSDRDQRRSLFHYYKEKDNFTLQQVQLALLCYSRLDLLRNAEVSPWLQAEVIFYIILMRLIIFFLECPFWLKTFALCQTCPIIMRSQPVWNFVGLLERLTRNVSYVTSVKMSPLLKCHLCENFPIEIVREVKFSWSLMTFPVRLPVHPPDQKPI